MKTTTNSNKNVSTKPQVVARKLLYKGDEIVSVLVPKSAEVKTAPHGEYLHFACPIKGGAVNFHLYANGAKLESLIGEKVNARPEVFRKIMSNSARHPYVDLYAVDLPTTHRLSVLHEKKSRLQMQDGHLMFSADKPREGTIVIMPKNGKIKIMSKKDKQKVGDSVHYQTSGVDAGKSLALALTKAGLGATTGVTAL